MAESAAFSPPKANLVKGKMIFLVIYPDSTNAPTFAATHAVTSVARSAAGKFLVTLKHNYRKVRGVIPGYNTSADNVDLYAQGGAVSNENSANPVTLVVKLKTGSTNTDAAAADPDNFISVCFVAEDSNALGTTL